MSAKKCRHVSKLLSKIQLGRDSFSQEQIANQSKLIRASWMGLDNFEKLWREPYENYTGKATVDNRPSTK